MPTKYDVIVLGLGAMGSAALYQLAKRGVKVLGIDQFSPPHDAGSSHGDTRITRLAIGEGEHYTPLVRRSHDIWREIEHETGADLLTQCGELIISSDNKSAFTHVEDFFRKTVDAAIRHGISHQLLDSGQIRQRYPAFNVRDDEYGYFEPEAGFLRPEACIAAELSLAQKHGAEIRRNERVMDYSASPQDVQVATNRRSYTADTLIVAAGAWLPQFLGGDFVRLLRVYRQVLHWFAIDGDAGLFAPRHFPVFIWELPDTRQGVYGFPLIDGSGLKVATEQYADTTEPGGVDRDVSPDDAADMHRRYVAPYFRGVTARCTKSVVCLYTVTPDAGFIIDRLPDAERVIVASCCSGHGFKHSAAIGETLADMATGRDSPIDLAPFCLSRFG
ncbi:MAG: N-methyl-L-tryptophan oxidase [Rhizomicrobium sp.]|jgi:sarcosine oxidase